MIRGPVQFLLDASGRPQYAVLPIEDYWAITGDPEAAAAQQDYRPEPSPQPQHQHQAPQASTRPAPPPFEIPEDVAAAIAGGQSPVAAWREHRGLTREILAGWIGFDEEDIENFEDSDGVPTVEIMQMIANALNVPIQVLVPGLER
ncbi:MAG: helix-turn-helix domain-containing protein [Alphaproteobacteria bacterium]